MKLKSLAAVLRETAFIVLLAGAVLLLEAWLLTAFYYDISIDGVLFHLRYYDTLFTSKAVNLVYAYVWGWTFLGVITGYVLLRRYCRRYRWWVLAGLYLLLPAALIKTLDVVPYIFAARHEEGFYEQYYQKPEAKFVTAERPNLIIIYLESMERSFIEHYSPEQVPSLKTYQQQELSFDRFISVTGTWWTMGAIVGGWCGIPSQIRGNKLSFPNVICLPDILAAYDYQMFFIKGSAVRFAGLDEFLLDHGFTVDDFVGMMQLMPQLKDIKISSWGFEDAHIYKLFKQRLVKMAEQKQPFFAVMETIDTHQPYAEFPPQCSGSAAKFADVIRCADQQVTDFIKWFQKQEFAANTVLVVMGDHHQMAQDWETAEFKSDIRRSIYNVIFNSRAKSEADKQHAISTLDMFPTILESLGMKVVNHRAGLGVSAFAPQTEPTLLEKLEVDELNRNLYGRSRFYQQFSQ